MKPTWILLILFFSSVHVFAQQPNYADSLLFYYQKSDFKTAIFWAKKNVEQNKKINPSDSAYGASLNDLGVVSRLAGDYDSAELFLLQALDVRGKLYGLEDINYAETLVNLSVGYQDAGRYNEALPMMWKAADIYGNKLGKDNANYAIALGNLAVLYIHTENYSVADSLLIKCLEIRKKISGPTSSDYANSLNTMSTLYMRMGNYHGAEPLCQEAVKIYERYKDQELVNYALCLSNLGNIDLHTRNFIAADSLFEISVAINKKTLGENHQNYALSLNRYAEANRLMHRYAKSEELYKQSITVYKKAVGEDHPDYIKANTNLANFYFSIGNYAEAEPIVLKSVVATQKNLGESNTDYLDLINFIGKLYKATGKDSLAEVYYIKAMKGEKKLLSEKMDFLSEPEFLAYIKDRADFLRLYYSFLLESQSTKTQLLLPEVYNSNLLFTGISIQNTTSLSKQMSQSSDSMLTSLWKSYQSNKLKANKLLTIPVSKRVVSFDSINNKANQQEKELLRSSAHYRHAKDMLNITWLDVRNSLQPNEAAVEFVRFKYFDKIETDSFYYAAMLVRSKDTIPIFIKLFEEKQLANALKSFAYKASTEIRGKKPNGILPLANLTTAIYKLVWRPLEPYFKNAKTIYFVPSGLLHQLAFAAVPIDKKLLLCDKYNLVQLTSTRQLALLKDKTPMHVPFALFGGIDYSRQSTDSTMKRTADAYAYAYQKNRGADVDSFNYLPGTLKEVQWIKNDLERQNGKAILLSGTNATEAAFRNLGGNNSPSIIHFATHAFTLPDIINKDKVDVVGNAFKISSDPLLRCGLVMAGGNKGWKGKAGLNEDDGILTGLEISSVNLQNTQLAVLSACETGLGKLEGTEGVFGLQRAFKLAGVKYVMASLWPVPDKETVEFMENFYGNLSSVKDILNAFLITQHTMRKKYSPYYWAAFTLVQ